LRFSHTQWQGSVYATVQPQLLPVKQSWTTRHQFPVLKTIVGTYINQRAHIHTGYLHSLYYTQGKNRDETDSCAGWGGGQGGGLMGGL